MRQKKQAITLLEIMVVILLIGIISTVIGVNMKGGLQRGKAFQVAQAVNRVQDILELELVKGDISSKDIAANPVKYLTDSGLVKAAEAIQLSNLVNVEEDGAGVKVSPK